MNEKYSYHTILNYSGGIITTHTASQLQYIIFNHYGTNLYIWYYDGHEVSLLTQVHGKYHKWWKHIQVHRYKSRRWKVSTNDIQTSMNKITYITHSNINRHQTLWSLLLPDWYFLQQVQQFVPVLRVDGIVHRLVVHSLEDIHPLASS